MQRLHRLIPHRHPRDEIQQQMPQRRMPLIPQIPKQLPQRATVPASKNACASSTHITCRKIITPHTTTKIPVTTTGIFQARRHHAPRNGATSFSTKTLPPSFTMPPQHNPSHTPCKNKKPAEEIPRACFISQFNLSMGKAFQLGTPITDVEPGSSHGNKPDVNRSA